MKSGIYRSLPFEEITECCMGLLMFGFSLGELTLIPRNLLILSLFAGEEDALSTLFCIDGCEDKFDKGDFTSSIEDEDGLGCVVLDGDRPRKADILAASGALET